ncbi:MAG TPA: mandelate racemase/muconate lactonizing enzyme family protein [Candidatus Paceibacterota bacterium]|nr:mandelate racemase/muconate lactonizing enzyme family protein [Verrucomicrobiota bacterium]HRY49042.1 mandelate racemase/muconate lactonizing enzyme family protein [Candidatus Paceibacterota bacterium]HSA01446.1 mandelate racemase/muconate lactonizing enzyme family protein [Candidatus Paceibacterota bacterium]
MSKITDVRIKSCRLFFLPVHTRVPLKFGPETLTSVTCARVAVRVENGRGESAEGWGETPLSVQWVWPSPLPYEIRHQCLKRFCLSLGKACIDLTERGHALELGHSLQTLILPGLLRDHWQTEQTLGERMPWLAALVCCSAFDLAFHDAYGRILGLSTYDTYGPEFLNRDLSFYLESAPNHPGSYANLYPRDFLVFPRPHLLPAWHLVGGLDPLTPGELTGNEPRDGHPCLLADWIRQDGLKCLKVKLRGTDPAWDYARLVAVGKMASNAEVDWLSADFNCTVTNPEYVNDILDRLLNDHPRIYGSLLYVEQPFPYDLEEHQLDVHSVSARKPLFLDESAHDWRLVRLGRSLGWSGVALKTCKTQTGALLSLCWAKSHGMCLMVQDLTNPMLAQIPHVLLAAHAQTIMGVETNSMQFYPEASAPESCVHPGLYRRRNGNLDLTSIRGPGFGYRLDEITRPLPDPTGAWPG